jgi:hypothetical protein
MKKQVITEQLDHIVLEDDLEKLIEQLRQAQTKAKKYSKIWIKFGYEDAFLYGERLETDEEYASRMAKVEKVRLIKKQWKQSKLDTARKLLEKEGYTITK